MRDRLADIAAFVHAVDAKSFTRAAQQLGLTRSAVGKSVARLEQRLGARLLHRTTRSLSPSQDGAMFYRHCVRLLQDLDEAELAVTRRGEEAIGLLRVDLPVTFGRLHGMPLMTEFLKRWPAVAIQASFTDRFTDLVAEGIDLAIRIGGEHDNRLVGRTLVANRFVVCASPDYLARHDAPADPEALRDHDCLTFVSNGRALDWRFRSATQSWTQAVSGRLRLDSAETIREAALAGAGLAQLDLFAVSDDLRSGRLVAVLEHFAADGPPIRAVYPSRRFLSPKVRLFIDAAAASWKKPPWDRR